ncbi:tRNAse Z4 [Zea mays]|uniref:ribonuclease Z n=1 Tax=Zea mays TaxID=4577 RepID=A0A1D6FH77_MAIZE|nr:tRNAse Z4 [Zea mays]
MDKEVAFNRKRAEGKDGGKRGSMELKTRRLNPVNTTCYVQILGTGMDTQDTSPSILLFFDKQRFIFNAGEGLQRFCTEHKIKLSKIDHIFLTRVCSETAGGLPGLVLTLAGIGDEGMSVNIWGPSDLDFLAGAMRSFIPNRAMLHTHSFGADRNASSPQSTDSVIVLDDEVVRVSAMFVKPKYNNGTGSSNDSDMKPGDTAIVYACELPEIKGKFDPSKAAALGLRPGPKYRELQLGNSVQSDQFDEMVSPRPLERFLNAYSTLEHLDMQFLDCRHTLKSSVEAFLSENDTDPATPQLETTMFAPGTRMENYNRKPASPRDTTALANFKEVLQESGLEILYSVPVLHCPQAFGVVLKAMEKANSTGKVIPGWKVVYSGDTRPCPGLIDASRDATVLIHEATFEDSMKDEAIARNHSTTKEAIEVGTSAGAYRIILTHFSQRYPKIPVIDEVDMEKTCIAFDLMSVNLADLPVVPKVLPHLKVLFKDELVVDEAEEVQEAAVY